MIGFVIGAVIVGVLTLIVGLLLYAQGEREAEYRDYNETTEKP
jgi:hypothetical protein